MSAVARPLGQLLYVAPDIYNKVALDVDPGTKVAEPDESRAQALVDQAQEAAEQGQVSLALQLASQALVYNPGHPVARSVLGYKLHEGQWQTPYQAEQSQRGYTWHPTFGWVRPEDLSKLQEGQRPHGKRWVDTEVDQARHQEIKQGWQVRTDHFLVTTNRSPEAAVRLGAELESLFQVWRQLFAGYYLEPREIKQRFAGERSARKMRRPLKVFYHRDKTSYVEHLVRRQPRVDQTLGIYFDTVRQSHFYHIDDPQLASLGRATLYHEAVHQLFQETSPKGRSPGANANFWAIEGVACYFETLAPLAGGSYTIGSGGRIRSAAQLGLVLPTDELVALGQSDLQRQTNLAEIYAQSAAMVAMLMHDPESQNREALVRYLRKVYGGRPDSQELATQLKSSYPELDAEYLRFLEQIRENLSVP